MIYRKPIKKESKLLAVIHSHAFNDFFLTELGLPFLKTYYKAATQAKGSIAICAVNEQGRIIGFATGCEHSNRYNRRLVIKNILPFSLQAIRIFFTRPKALYRLLKNFEKKTNSADDGNYAELLSIAVLPEAKGLGVGKELLERFEKEARDKRCNKLALTTDFYNNDQIVEFYTKNGFCIFYDFYTYPNRRMYKLIKDLN
jgi:ribosomal protein S18 acetylase RimI-like enzyme